MMNEDKIKRLINLLVSTGFKKRNDDFISTEYNYCDSSIIIIIWNTKKHIGTFTTFSGGGYENDLSSVVEALSEEHANEFLYNLDLFMD